MKCAVYDRTKCPDSWDFLQWLVNLRMAYPDLRNIKFIHGYRNDGLARSPEQREAIFHNVMRPSLSLLGFEEGDGEEVEYVHYFIRNAVRAARAGVPVPKWQIPQWAMDGVAEALEGRKPIVITLREATYYPARNSNLEAWKQFARECGEDVIFVRDTAKANESLEGFETFPAASVNVSTRAALMAQAKANLLVANGPIALLEYMDVPWLTFKFLTPEIADWRPGHPAWWEKMGVPEGTQLPWSNDKQRIVWADDSLEVLREVWPEFKKAINGEPHGEIGYVKPRPYTPKRRRLTRAWKKQIEEIKHNSAKYGDSLTRVDTVEMWENCDDRLADCQIVCNIIEHLPDVDGAMANIKELADKAVLFLIELDSMRDAEAWRTIISRYFSIVNFEKFGTDRVVVIAANTMKVQGVIPIAAGTQDGRWENIAANSAAVTNRVKKASAHGRKAVIACYGPTLKDNVEKLLDELDDNADLISVSGSHDFLINQGIIPKYHVECDPRPHKADNIEAPQIGVEYLLGSLVSPLLIEKLKDGNLSLWHLSGEQSIRVKDELEPEAWFVGGRGNVGNTAVALLYELGYRDFSIFGMDCSFSDDGKERWSGPHAQKNSQTEHPVVAVKVEDRVFMSSHIHLVYATAFLDIIKRMPDAQFRIYGDSLLQAWCRLTPQKEAA